MFKHYARRPRVAQTSYYVTDLAHTYKFPVADGAGQTIGIIELGGGYSLRDLNVYGNRLGLPSINITSVSVDGASNNPNDTSGANDEVMLDIEVMYSLVPRAALRVYFAPNTDQGFEDAIKDAIADKCNVISISWGGSEDSWEPATIAKFEQVFEQAAIAGVTVLAAAGDSGYQDSPTTDTPTVDYPSSSNFVLACGGTQITGISRDLVGEVVWNNLDIGEGATGGGVSSLFGRPAWQSRDHITQTNRCVPDVSANGSPLSGYNIYVNGSWQVVAGTSAVAPLMGALIARLNQLLGKNIGYANPVFYALNQRSWYDITKGNNGYWTSNQNYDLASGLGRIKGDTLVDDVKWALDNLK